MIHKNFKYANVMKNELINIFFCSNCDIIDRKSFSDFVIKLSNEIVVKFDIRIKKIKTKNLKKIYDIVRIFRVYHLFNCNSFEYIVIKYVKNRIIDSLKFFELINEIALTMKISRIFV